jgi:hypothetical protein
MAAYKDLVGQKITKVTSNPGEPKTGQMWYNSTDGKLRGLGILRAWASASPLSTARSVLGGFGIQTSSVMYGGTTNSTEEYNGTGFSAGGNLNTGRPNCQDNGWGVETAAVVASGYDGSNNTANVEEYDGSSFSEVNNVSSARRQQASIGLVQTAGAICGGYTSTNVDSTEEYDGTNWTSGGSLNTSRRGFAGSGTLTAGIVFSGYTTTVVANTEEYDGTSWTTATSINSARNNGAAASNAPQSTAMLFGGNTGSDTGKTEQYNGTSWTEVADMATARDSLGGSGIGTAALAAGGAPPPGNVAIAEEFTQSTNTITAAAWASGGTYPYAAANVVSLGPATAMLNCGGNNSGPTKQTTVTLYNGTSYSSETAMPAAANGMGQGKGGTETAGLVFGGNNPGSNAATDTILYNGSSWTSGGDLSTGRRNLGGLGISTAALAFGGQEPSYSTATEEYGGSSWTSGGALPAARRNPTGVGSQTAGLVLGGQSPPAVGVNTSFTYNGTSYSGGPTMINNRSDAAASGPNSSNTSALVYGGSAGAPPYTVLLPTETYDGSAFSTSPSLSTGRDGQGSGASSTEGVQVAGYVPSGSYLSATEQFTPETTAANITDFTTS